MWYTPVYLASAYALFGEKSRPTALLGIRLCRGRERVVKIEIKLWLIIPFVQVHQLLPKKLLPKDRRIMGFQLAGRKVVLVHD